MDGQNQHPMPNQDHKLQSDISKVLNQGPAANPQAAQSPPAQAQPTPVNKLGEPKKAMTDADAQALLATFNMQNPKKEEHKLPMGMLITIATLILIVIIASVSIGALKSKGGSSPSNTGNTGSSSSSNQSNSATDNTSNEINNDANSCANPAVAVSEC